MEAFKALITPMLQKLKAPLLSCFDEIVAKLKLYLGCFVEEHFGKCQVMIDLSNFLEFIFDLSLKKSKKSFIKDIDSIIETLFKTSIKDKSVDILVQMREFYNAVINDLKDRLPCTIQGTLISKLDIHTLLIQINKAKENKDTLLAAIYEKWGENTKLEEEEHKNLNKKIENNKFALKKLQDSIYECSKFLKKRESDSKSEREEENSNQNNSINVESSNKVNSMTTSAITFSDLKNNSSRSIVGAKAFNQ